MTELIHPSQFTPASAYDWPSIFGSSVVTFKWHYPALSKAAEATIEAAQQAKKLDCSVSMILTLEENSGSGIMIFPNEN